MKIVSKGKKVTSTKLIVPIDGMIEIDNEGIADVSAKCAAILVNNTNDWDFLRKQKETEVVEETEETTEEETEQEETTEEETEETEEQSEEKMLEELNNSSLEQLRSMCAEAGFPEKEWKNLSKKLLVKYMLKKYQEAE